MFKEKVNGWTDGQETAGHDISSLAYSEAKNSFEGTIQLISEEILLVQLDSTAKLLRTYKPCLTHSHTTTPFDASGKQAF